MPRRRFHAIGEALGEQGREVLEVEEGARALRDAGRGVGARGRPHDAVDARELDLALALRGPPHIPRELVQHRTIKRLRVNTQLPHYQDSRLHQSAVARCRRWGRL